MAMIVRDLMIGNPRLAAMGFGEEALGHNALVSGFQGQRQWTDHFPNGDFLEAVLNSSFDWNGLREPFVVATENDSLNGTAMLFGHLLTNTAQIFSDVRTFWSPESVKRVSGKELSGRAADGIIHLINSGSSTLDGTGRQRRNGRAAMKPFWDISSQEAIECLEATRWCPAELEYFRGGGFSSLFLTQGDMPITMSRINRVKGLGPVLQIAEGFTVTLPEDVHNTLSKRTSPISYGHIGDALITLASILRIPVNMHNVAPDRILRPSFWNALGTAEPEGADFRACALLGPLYGK